MRIENEYLGELIALDIEPAGDGYTVRLPSGEQKRITAHRLPNDVLQIAIHTDSGVTRTVRIPFARSDKEAAFALNGEAYVFTPPAPRRAGKVQKTLSGALTAPMVGVVADVLVTEGQPVEKGQPLVILGAMKVYVTLSAPFAGTVTKVSVKKDDLVAHGALVVDVEPTPGPLPMQPSSGSFLATFSPLREKDFLSPLPVAALLAAPERTNEGEGPGMKAAMGEESEGGKQT